MQTLQLTSRQHAPRKQTADHQQLQCEVPLSDTGSHYGTKHTPCPLPLGLPVVPDE